MERGLKIPQSDRTKTTSALLVSLMKQLEKDKKSLKLGPEDQLHLEGFALNVFAKADKQDQAGKADLSTAKTYYAASIFFEILNQFGELQPDAQIPYLYKKKQKYAALKAADIRKALKEGRKPDPGPPAGESDFSEFSTAQSGELDVEPTRADLAIKSAPESPPPSQPLVYQDIGASDNFRHFALKSDSSSRLDDPANRPSDSAHSSDTPPSLPSYPAASYPSHDFHPPPPISGHGSSSYSQQLHEQPSLQEPQQHLSMNYSSYDVIPSSYPNFQSYPGFTESSLPSLRTIKGLILPIIAQLIIHQPDNTTQVTETEVQRKLKFLRPKHLNDQPSDKIAEALKAAKFAIGALSFDDIDTAVDYLKKSLELLTKPSADQ